MMSSENSHYERSHWVHCAESNKGVRSEIYDPNGNAMTYGDIAAIVNELQDENHELRGELENAQQPSEPSGKTTGIRQIQMDEQKRRREEAIPHILETCLQIMQGSTINDTTVPGSYLRRKKEAVELLLAEMGSGMPLETAEVELL